MMMDLYFVFSVCIAAPPIPSKIDKDFKKLTGMKDHLKFKPDLSKPNEVDLPEMEFRFLSDRLSSPLTLLFAGSKCGLKDKNIEKVRELNIHIVGSNVMEMLGIIKWE